LGHFKKSRKDAEWLHDIEKRELVSVYLGANYKQTSNYATENKLHKNSVYFVPRTSEITIRYSSQ